MGTNILVVDDDKSIRNLIKVYLENEGYNIMEASNGAEALILINENNFDLVILDVMMPVLDGISAV
jgi:CheY-like chemotaxis protein